MWAAALRIFSPGRQSHAGLNFNRLPNFGARRRLARVPPGTELNPFDGIDQQVPKVR